MVAKCHPSGKGGQIAVCFDGDLLCCKVQVFFGDVGCDIMSMEVYNTLTSTTSFSFQLWIFHQPYCGNYATVSEKLVIEKLFQLDCPNCV